MEAEDPFITYNPYLQMTARVRSNLKSGEVE